jgi:hypothetical protein
MVEVMKPRDMVAVMNIPQSINQRKISMTPSTKAKGMAAVRDMRDRSTVEVMKQSTSMTHQHTPPSSRKGTAVDMKLMHRNMKDIK